MPLGATMTAMPDVWASGDEYEPYVGRWSRLVAAEFLNWLAVPLGCRWLDFGCGTGALTAAILASRNPAEVVGVDPSPGYVSWAAGHLADTHSRFVVGDASQLPEGPYNAVVSGLVLNFVPEATETVRSMCSVVGDEGVVAAYVWDYAGRMDLMRYFWDAAIALNPAAAELDEGVRFPMCQPDRLEELWREAGLDRVSSRPIDVPTVFEDFADYWEPFLGGQAPAPGYCMSLDEARRADLREYLRRRLPVAADGSIRLIARAWAVKGQRH